MFPAVTDPAAWSYSTYDKDGPTKVFLDLESAQEYIDFVANLNPVSMTITVNE